jgi:hypothetical protein
VHLRRNILVPAVALAFLVLAAVPTGAAPVKVTRNAQPVFFAATLNLQKGTRRDRRCGPYRVTTATYVGQTFSAEPRLAGQGRYRAKLAINLGGTHGVATGTFTIRNGGLRMRATVRGVITFTQAVNGLLLGTLFRPTELMIMNLSMTYNGNLTFAAVRAGMEQGQNTGVSYQRVPNC